MSNKILNTILLLLIIGLLYLLSGCSMHDAMSENLREEQFNQGCKVVQANTNLGYMSQTGTVGVPCKLKCSKELPKNYCFKYNSKTPYGNCNVQVGECKNDNSTD